MACDGVTSSVPHRGYRIKSGKSRGIGAGPVTGYGVTFYRRKGEGGTPGGQSVTPMPGNGDPSASHKVTCAGRPPFHSSYRGNPVLMGRGVARAIDGLVPSPYHPATS